MNGRQPRLSTWLRAVLPGSVRLRLRRRFPAGLSAPPTGFVRWGSFRRRDPISGCFGFDRGLPIDRYYIEAFLERHADDIRGHVLEVKDSTYTDRFGGARVTRRSVLDIDATNPEVTVVVDLNDATGLPDRAFDCIILTQTLLLIYDVRSALAHLHRALKPEGVMLVTVPGLTPIAHAELGETWYWSFTAASMRRLLLDQAPLASVTVEAHGNVLAATAFLQGLAAGEVRRSELDHVDPAYQIIVAARMAKAAAP